jgi:glycosyltransferase involved in cell wall biosynthesis
VQAFHSGTPLAVTEVDPQGLVDSQHLGIRGSDVEHLAVLVRKFLSDPREYELCQERIGIYLEKNLSREKAINMYAKILGVQND